jgi:hypothetical protein
LWAYLDMPWEIDGFVMPKYLEHLWINMEALVTLMPVKRLLNHLY